MILHFDKAYALLRIQDSIQFVPMKINSFRFSFGLLIFMLVAGILGGVALSRIKGSPRQLTSIVKSEPIPGYKSNTGTVTSVTEHKGLYQVTVWLDGHPETRPAAISGKQLNVGDRVTLWWTSFGRSLDGTNFHSSFMSFPLAELVHDQATAIEDKR